MSNPSQQGKKCGLVKYIASLDIEGYYWGFFPTSSVCKCDKVRDPQLNVEAICL